MSGWVGGKTAAWVFLFNCWNNCRSSVFLWFPLAARRSRYKYLYILISPVARSRWWAGIIQQGINGPHSNLHIETSAANERLRSWTKNVLHIRTCLSYTYYQPAGRRGRLFFLLNASLKNDDASGVGGCLLLLLMHAQQPSKKEAIKSDDGDQPHGVHAHRRRRRCPWSGLLADWEDKF